MARIAIIDDWINPHYISKKIPIRYIPVRKTETLIGYQSEDYTHATIITKVLELYADNYEILNILLAGKLDEPQDIRDIRTALEICLNESIDIVCMSFGTDRISEGIYVDQLIRQLYEKDVILIAAADNDGNYMLPAAMPEVIGVDLDRKETVGAGEYIFKKKNFKNVDVAVNCNLSIFLKGRRFYPSTSFSVPVIAARINEFLNQGYYGQEEIREQLRRRAGKLEIRNDDIQELRGANTLPIIGSYEIDTDEWIQVMQVMNQRWGYETIGIDHSGTVADYRFITVDESDKTCWEKQLDLIERHTTADLILVALENEHHDCDVIIEKENGKYRCLVPETQIEKLLEDVFCLCKWIVDILS